MPTQVKARYANGKLEPLEPLNLSEGCLVTLSVSDEEPAPESESLLEMFDRLHRKYPPETRGDAPTDGAKNYKHYLYGHPKVED
ncbi:MAG: DUF104 domain-containing protein [Chloroflexi bacterium]|nr:DUF104 domain-containing protein [Chloroflexota bacterium]